jgi:hypothetical protein
MPKDPTKNVDRYKIRGGQLNEFDFHRNQEDFASKQQEQNTDLIPGTPPEAKTKTAASKKATGSKKATKSTKVAQGRKATKSPEAVKGASAKKLAARKAAKKKK